jgi:uncharacterized repeat protein (TIGR01451 family)
MLRRLTKKRNFVVLTAVAALAIAGGAFAYLSSTGTGGGSGSVTTSSAALTLSISNAPALTKIGDTETYEITASNTGSNPEHVSGISVTSIAPSAAALSAGCPTTSFTAGAPTVTGTEVPAGGSAVVGNVAVTFNDVNAAQDSCLGTDTVALGLSSN